MKDKIMHNFGLKILAVLCSAVLWFIVVNISDPETSSTYYSIPVIIENDTIITNDNKVYEILDDTDVVNVTIVAKRSIIDRISDSDIRVVADFSNLTLSDTIELQLSTTVYNSSLSSIKANISTMKLDVEDKVQKQFRIEATTTGDVEDGYLIGGITTDTNLVNISGAESLINQVARVEANVNISGMISDVSAKADLKFYDSDDNLLDSSNITKNVSSVLVTVEILATKTVNIVASYMGVPAEGYLVNGTITISPATVLLAGKEDVLDQISSISIPAEAINITGRTEDMSTVVSIEDYLSDDVIFGDSTFNGKATVTVGIEKEYTKEIPITDTNLEVLNVPEGMEYEIVEFGEDEEDQNLVVQGLQSDLSTTTSTSIYPVIDLNDLLDDGEETLSAGTYKIVPEVKLSENIEIVSNPELTVILRKIEEN